MEVAAKKRRRQTETDCICTDEQQFLTMSLNTQSVNTLSAFRITFDSNPFAIIYSIGGHFWDQANCKRY